MVEGVIQWVSIGIAASGVVATVIQTLKNRKKRKTVELAKIVQQIPEIINEAEELLGKHTGKAKLSYCLNKLYIKCLQSGIGYDEQGLTEEIENILSTPQKGVENEKTINEEKEAR